MNKNKELWRVQRNQLKFSYEALYKDIASAFGLSPTAAWVLYSLMDAQGKLEQRELGKKWNFPKQTVTSCIQKLSREGYVILEPIPGTRNQKEIQLTEKGKKLADKTVRLLARAEERAADYLTEAEKEQYLSLSRKFFHAIERESKTIRKREEGTSGEK